MVLILGTNSDVAKLALKLYIEKGFRVLAASRSTEELKVFLNANLIDNAQADILYFDAGAFETHHQFYQRLPMKPHIVVYAAGCW